MSSLLQKAIWIFSTSLLSTALVFAQVDNCPELVNHALESIADNCAETGRNEACYGYNRVEASFLNDVSDDFFTEPADISPVADLATIRTLPLNLETDRWGVALMNLQADLPNTLPGQSVSFILMGDVEVENAVAPETAFQASNGINLIIAADNADVRSGAGLNFNVLGTLPAGDTVLADGLSEDLQWLRIIFAEAPAWIERTSLETDAAIDDLPILTDKQYTPMQAFYLRTGIGQPECNEAPDNVLLVQGPEDIEIQLNVNGANIRLGSSGALRVVMVDEQPFLDIVVFDGEFEVDGVVIERGEHSMLCLGNEDSRGLDGASNDLAVTCPASEPEPVNPADFNAAWCSLENLSGDVLNYALTACYQSHTIANGENLFRIAQFYCVGLDELVALNAIANPEQIFVGQSLFIPLNACAGQGSTRPPQTATSTPPTTNNPSQTVGVDCSTFSIPAQEVIATNFSLSWTEATGADTYELAIFDNNGYQVSTLQTNTNSIVANGGESFPPAGYVDVRAYRAGAYACYVRMNFTRVADPNPVIVFNARILSCGADAGNYKADIAWENASNTPVTITYNSNLSGTVSTTSNARSGQITILSGYFVYSFNSISISDGASTIDLGAC